jgi:hypothetical protein
MITKWEVNKRNKPVAIYHRTGNITVDGIVRRDERYVWTHKPNKEDVCCTEGRMPPDLLKEERDGS